MQRETQLALAREIQQYARTRSTALAGTVLHNPVASYSDPARAALEHERLFRAQPLFVAMSCRLPAPGDYLAEEIARVPVLVVRGADGTLRAFVNICRHRGAPVATGHGNARVFSCPYHGWTYALDGTLKGIPEESSFPGVEKRAHGLAALPVAERHGMIFVRLAPDAGAELDLDKHLGAMSDELQAYGFQRYRYFASEWMTPAINWKFGIDTFLESYHLPTLHRNTVAPLILGNLAPFTAFGDHARLTMVRPGAAEWEQQPEAEWDVLRHIVPIYRVFPNTVVVFQSDHLETWRMLPGEAPDRCRIEFALYTPEPPATEKARGYWQKNYDLAIRTVKEEDFALGEKMQRGFMSAMQKEVVYGRNEPALIHFHQRLRAALE